MGSKSSALESVGLNMNMDKAFYKGKRVLVSGHTGFKGAWLCNILSALGANVWGYGLAPDSADNIYDFTSLDKRMHSVIGDIRDLDHLSKVFDECKPEIVFHLAAQPIVRDSYRYPVYTYETNVMGTVNICECVRKSCSVRSFLNVTTDKVYLNKEWEWGYREIDELNGFDPYSNSKSCSELVTHSYIKAFFQDLNISASTARAGNVIGGGDFANDRIIPDCVRKASKNEVIMLRNPYSIRPYQHVLEPLFAYLTIAEKQYQDAKVAGSYNIGPDECDCVTTGELADLFCKYWTGAKWESCKTNEGPHEARFLKLDCSKFKSVFGWKPCWHIDKAIEETVLFYQEMLQGNDIVLQQIDEFMRDMERL